MAEILDHENLNVMVVSHRVIQLNVPDLGPIVKRPATGSLRVTPGEPFHITPTGVPTVKFWIQPIPDALGALGLSAKTG